MKTKKVFFDVKSGKLAAEGVDDCLVFKNQAKVLVEHGVPELYSPTGVKVLSGFSYCYVHESGLAHILFDDDKHYVYRMDGVCVISGADDVIFYAGGWFTSQQRGVINLYTPSGALAGHDIKKLDVTPRGKFAITQDEDGYFVLYNKKGVRYACGFLNFLGDDEAFVLNYVDKLLMIDVESFSETEFSDVSISVLKHKKFHGVSRSQNVLYDSSGKSLLSGYMDYKVYANGMYRGINHPGTFFCGKKNNHLYDAKGNKVLGYVLDVEEYDSGCLAVLVEEGIHLYDSKGKHIAFLDQEEALGKCLEDNCFTLEENGKEVLYLADRTKVAEDVDKVSVFASGLILTEKKLSSAQKSVLSLYDAQGNFLCRSEDFLSFDEMYGYYVRENGDANVMSVWKDGKEVLSNLSGGLFEGRLMKCECEEDGKVLVYDLSQGVEEPIWSGSLSDNVVFCDLEEDFDRFCERNF